MNVQVRNQSECYTINSEKFWNLSIPTSFDENNLSCFGVEGPMKRPYQAGSFIGSVQQKGSCNCDVIEWIPHCHGTHTECVGHILEHAISVPDVFNGGIFLAEVVTVEGDANLAIVSDELQKKSAFDQVEAMIIRTFPNNISKKTKRYGPRAHYLSKDAIDWILCKGVQHLLVDFPSIDPIEDGGQLLAHRTFWNVEKGRTELRESTWKQKTVTELIFVPDDVRDGRYLLSLQISNLNLDAVPSTPILYEIEKTS